MSLRRAGIFSVIAAAALCGIGWMLSAPLPRADEERLWQYRNLGKAFYENPTTQKQAVEEFRKARDLAPDSPREVLNYGLALLRAGDIAGGVAQLEKAQKLDPQHSAHVVQSRDRVQEAGGFRQGEGAVRADGAPGAGRCDHALSARRAVQDRPATCRRRCANSRRARELNPRLAAPHFQFTDCTGRRIAPPMGRASCRFSRN